jgi:hypothetical protein
MSTKKDKKVKVKGSNNIESQKSEAFKVISNPGQNYPEPISGSSISILGTARVKDLIIFNQFPKWKREKIVRLMKTREGIIESPENKPKPGGGDFWAYALKGIKDSIVNNDVNLGKAKIQSLTDLKTPDNKDRFTCIDDNISMINHFVSSLAPRFLKDVIDRTSLPVDKELVSIEFENLKVLIRPDFLFRGKLNGKPIIGAVCLLLSKTVKYTETQRKAVAFLLAQNLQKRFKLKTNEVVSLEHCLCIDIRGNAIVGAPSGADIPHKALLRMKDDYLDVWKTVLK